MPGEGRLRGEQPNLKPNQARHFLQAFRPASLVANKAFGDLDPFYVAVVWASPAAGMKSPPQV